MDLSLFTHFKTSINNSYSERLRTSAVTVAEMCRMQMQNDQSRMLKERRL